MTAASTLRAVPLLSQLRESDIEVLATLLIQRDYPKNRVVLLSHDPVDAFYVVLSGQIKVMLIAEDGREVILSVMGPGDFFGEMALMDEEPYASSAIAMEESSLLMLRRDDFRRSITEMPGMALGLLRALCGRLREADHKIGGLVLLDVAGRVATLFLEMAAKSGGDTIPETPTHQVISQMVGTSRESVSRTISSLTSQGYIEPSGKGFKILNREALEKSVGQLLKRHPRAVPQDRRGLDQRQQPR